MKMLTLGRRLERGMGSWDEESVEGGGLMGMTRARREIVALMWAVHWIREGLQAAVGPHICPLSNLAC